MKKWFFCVALLMLCCLWGCAGTRTVGQTASTAESPSAQENAVPSETSTPVETTTPPDPLEAILHTMTPEQKVGQLFIVACPTADTLGQISRYQFGGVILFGKNIEGETPESLKAKLSQYQGASSIPLLIAADEEGGTVCRISGNTAFRESRFPSPGKLLEQGGMDLLLQTEGEKSRLLADLGINVNLSPVCDIATDPNAFMYSRSLRLSPEQTASTVKAMLDVMNANGIGGVLKHFPGYGNNTDTHVAMALDTRSLEQLEQTDLVPFRGTSAGAIMVSHTVVTAFDDQMPASLSQPVHTYLRETMAFEGVIMTDDLTMGAISSTFGDGEAAVLAVLAGNDLICTWEYETQYNAVLTAVNEGRITPEQLDAAVLRILRWKQTLGLLDFK